MICGCFRGGNNMWGDVYIFGFRRDWDLIDSALVCDIFHMRSLSSNDSGIGIPIREASPLVIIFTKLDF